MPERTIAEDWRDRSKLIDGPSLIYDDAAAGEFNALIDRAEAEGNSPLIEYRLRRPKYEFLCYLADRRGFQIHGSNNARIRSFEPRSQTDAGGRYVTRVFATPDGILPMYYAILNRSRYRGTLRNWSVLDRGEDGIVRRSYRFSINKDARKPWRRGTVYILPGDGFVRSADRDGEPTSEWTSAHPVRPAARLEIGPDDFPFLDRVERHDDSAALRIEDLQLRLITRYRGIVRREDGWAITIRGGDRERALLEELVALANDIGVLEDVTLGVGSDQDAPALVLSGPGAGALGAVVERRDRRLRMLLRVPGLPQLLVLLWRAWRR